MSIINPVRARRSLTHLLLAGHNPLSPPPSRSSARQPQAPSNPFLTPVPFSTWLGSIGRASDVLAGWSIVPNSLASGLAHSLISYESDGVHRVFAAGRNEMAQLAVGFNSHESTRGLVEGFDGDGIESVAAGSQSSYMLLREGGAFVSFLASRPGMLITRWERQHGRVGVRKPAARATRSPWSRDPRVHRRAG